MTAPTTSETLRARLDSRVAAAEAAVTDVVKDGREAIKVLVSAAFPGAAWAALWCEFHPDADAFSLHCVRSMGPDVCREDFDEAQNLCADEVDGLLTVLGWRIANDDEVEMGPERFIVQLRIS
ncbi:hypothetical protein [Frigoribacterium sp. SL97]|uniref:hypothetical protein n=1 Tax=Frigoribacterium sp. SL97 TaxID=2994664 RepID=UPI00226DDB78|nr:hypothetical protein [Frigoribacterium sp. SL97]WAC50546.1 hypothetical protein OVA02_11750 [Frigoribacterium sp. SL97]